MTSPDLVSTGWLAEQFSGYNMHDFRIVDCRWMLGQPGAGRRLYEEGHIPGALHLDVDEHLSGRNGPGRHPLPEKRDFENVLSGNGINRDHHVVAYDGGQGMPAARLWWMLKYFGHEKVSILDGGWKAWEREGRPTEREIRRYEPQRYQARAKSRMMADMAEVDRVRDEPETLLIDARAPERYRGEVEPIDKKAGHIPGAENIPFASLIDPETGLFLPLPQLQSVFQAAGVEKNRDVICYCGSGVTACTVLFALHLAGHSKARLYPGSWSEWASKDGNPIQTSST